MNPEIDKYLMDGCMRCEFGATPDCKVHNWLEELKLLRVIVLECGLIEELKWGVPCYTDKGKNILIVSAFKEYAALSFFKGAHLSDPLNLLQKPGENTQSARLFKFISIHQIIDVKEDLQAYIFEAIEVERSGIGFHFTNQPEPIPEELQQKFMVMPELEEAFFKLTPGRQRGYLLHFSQPKQSKTRSSRIDKYTNHILSGIGFHDNYKSR